MLSKYSLFFSILLLFSFSTFVTINSAEESIARESIYSSPLNINNEEETKERVAGIEELRKPTQTPYPLLTDMFHPKMVLFRNAANQLKAGKFKPRSHRGMFFYGPSGVGKTAMVKAMANESDCKLFKISASQLFNPKNGADAITKIFAQAKGVEGNKGIIIVIDSLESLTPRTTDDGNVQFSYNHQELDHSNTLTQLWAEFDDCTETHNNILVVAISNGLETINNHIHDQFKCIKFSCPDQDNSYKILKNKARYFNVPLSEPELRYHAKRMRGLSGRELVNFIQDVSEYISDGESKEKAIELTIKNEQKTSHNNMESFQKIFKIIENRINRYGKLAMYVATIMIFFNITKLIIKKAEIF